MFRTTVNLTGDFDRENSDIPLRDLLKGSIAIGYGIKPNSSSYFAFGVYAGYKFGSPSIYPGIVYSKRFSNGLGLDMMLPQSIKIWKKVNPGLFISAKSKVEGNSYAIKVNSSILDEAQSLQLRQSGILSSVNVLQKISKWIWLEASLGYSYNLSFNVTESNFVQGSHLLKVDTDYLIESKVDGAPYVSLSLSLAIPDDFIDKLSNKKGKAF
jgi:hypothetical protein